MRKTIFLLLIISQGVYSHTIIFKNGESIQGKIIKQTLNTVKLKAKTGEIKTYQKSKILKFVYQDLDKEEIKKIQTEESKKKKQKTKVPKKKKQTKITAREDSLSDRVEYLETRIEKLQADLEEQKEERKSRTEFYKQQNKLLKQELAYLKEERDKIQKKQEKEKIYKDATTKELNKLGVRTRRLEKFLKMDESQVEYYKRKRSKWDLVKRSAVFPGWGHDYAKMEKTGDFYRFTFLTSLLFGGLATLDVDSQKNKLKVERDDKLLTYGLLFGGSNVSSLGFLFMQPISTYNKKIANLELEERLGNILLGGALGIYIVQVVHAYITGVKWEKTPPRNYSNYEGFKISFHQDKVSKYNAVNTVSYPAFQLGYNISF